MVGVLARLARHETDHDLKTAAIDSGDLSTSKPASVRTERVSRSPCDRAGGRPRYVRAAIIRLPVMPNSPNGALSLFP
jgi:hypothetical protein